MTATNTANPNLSPDPKVIFQNDDYTLRYSGPPLTDVERVVMTFPHRIHSPGANNAGWGEAFLRRRGAAVLSVLFEKVDWYQSPGFFPAMEAARAFLGDRIAITTYGSSMGAYGAILAAARLGADRVVAACPQFSIEPDVAPFERRFRGEAEEIGPFRHDVTGELHDDISYFVLHDPTHTIDRRHIALFSQPANWRDILFPGTGHNTLPAMVEAGMKDAVFALIMGQMDAHAVRCDIRKIRRNSTYYIRRMGNLCARSPQRAQGRAAFIDLAKKHGFTKFAKRWAAADAAFQSAPPAPSIARSRGPDELILHIGLPENGAARFQAHMTQFADTYRAQGLTYPLLGNRTAQRHGFLSAGLVGRDFAELVQVMAQVEGGRMLLSDEALYAQALFADDALGTTLREALGQRPLRVIACTRDPEHWKISFYKQALRNRGNDRLDQASGFWGRAERYEAYLARPEIAEMTDPARMFGRISRLFGVDVEELELLPGTDVAPALLKLIGVTPAQGTTTPEGDLVLSDVDAELLRQANAQGRPAQSFMRALVEKLPMDAPAERVIQTLRAGQRAMLADMAPQFDWAALSYTPNPPLRYDRVAFEARRDALHARADALHSALLARKGAP